MRIGNKDFPLGERTYIMGILNVTPDSFSDGGKYTNIDSALRQAEKMIKEGVDILDIGGESTKPGYVSITDEQEINRVVPVIEAVKARFDVPISIDTYKSNVAKAALMAGADLLNDIWGFRHDECCAKLAAQYDVPVCLMHNRDNTEYVNLLPEVIEDLQTSIQIAKKHGVKSEKIILDPGIGFGKTLEQNRMVMNHLEDIVAMGYPVLLGTSRKSMIGLTLNLPVDEREEGTIATNVIGVLKGCGFVRVHDVEKNVRALKMTDAILRQK